MSETDGLTKLNTAMSSLIDKEDESPSPATKKTFIMEEEESDSIREEIVEVEILPVIPQKTKPTLVKLRSLS